MGDPIELTSGLEQMRESGVRRVVGATRHGIVVQFLTESLMIYRLAGREAAAGRCSPLRVGRLADSSIARAEEATGMGAAKTVVIVSLAFVLLAASVRAAPTGQPSDLSQLLQAAEQGDADAQATLGVWYFPGRDVEQDDELAVLWFRRAAEQGHAGAQFAVGTVNGVEGRFSCSGETVRSETGNFRFQATGTCLMSLGPGGVVRNAIGWVFTASGP